MILPIVIPLMPTLNNACNSNPFLCFVTGIKNVKYQSLDHFGLIPWFGFFLLGAVIGNLLYKFIPSNNSYDDDNINGVVKRKFPFLSIIEDNKDNNVVRLINWFGKRSLMIYLIHFVILWAIFNIYKSYNL